MSELARSAHHTASARALCKSGWRVRRAESAPPSTASSSGSTPQGRHDVFLAKLDAEGNELWTRQLGSAEEDAGKSLAVDHVGNVYVAGQWNTFDSFFAKYSPTGSLLWQQTLLTDDVHALTVDDEANVYVGGWKLNGNDMFVSRYTTDGVFEWMEQEGGTSTDLVYDLQWNSGDGLYAAGDTRSHFATPPGGRLDVGLIKVNVPEPSAFALTGVAMAAITARRRRT